jgi:hypothetical protein
MTENQEFIYQSLLSQVLMGLFPIDEIKESVIEEIESNGFENEISEIWATQLIDEEVEKLLAEGCSCGSFPNMKILILLTI